MSEQETLFVAFNPFDHGLYERMLSGTTIDHRAWLRTCAERAFVGTCRACGGYLAPRMPEEVGEFGRTDYEAVCQQGHTVCAPGGRYYRRSAMQSERKRAKPVQRG